MPSPAGALPKSFILPDLVNDCPFPLRVNPLCDEVGRLSEQWFLRHANYSPPRAVAFMALKAGELTAACYPDADAFHLRVSDDFMNFLFNADDWLDDFDIEDTYGLANCTVRALRDPVNFITDKRAGLMTKSYFSRFLKTAGPRCTERFIQTLALYFESVVTQKQARNNGTLPDLESYITIRRNNSGCKPCYALIEFCAGIDLPDEVINHPIIQSLEDASNDLIAWSNDIFSFNREQSRHDSFNMVSIVMHQKGFALQEAVNFVGELCKKAMERFQADKRNLPSWGPEIDGEVAMYVDGLQNWIVGSLNWSIDGTERYFGKDGPGIKKHRKVKLFPKRPLKTPAVRVLA
ncbi:terpene synthase [Coprinopsis cinerea okayama7|uniref:Terpene synthase n=1 Tax=Coprinopsis cinerea (strain Okayama-7 / 130 / ATCC MYA-4618 / FGSC 9003) TaxID=240176 RepID=A8NUX6_COPC7|nr:terpene synthase [Coprinopsis cinerea okayama7\|eukprot:XP_001836556.1 terpene synthase [Coprinopsis cinerea okayama7\